MGDYIEVLFCGGPRNAEIWALPEYTHEIRVAVLKPPDFTEWKDGYDITESSLVDILSYRVERMYVYLSGQPVFLYVAILPEEREFLTPLFPEGEK